MKIVFTDPNFNYACSELGRGLENALGTITAIANIAAEEYKDVDKTLVVVRACPCCCSLGEIPVDAILVTPFHGIDSAGLTIHQVDLYPPFERDSGHKEGAKDLKEFGEHWKKAIDEAVTKACPGAVRHHVPIGW